MIVTFFWETHSTILATTYSLTKLRDNCRTLVYIHALILVLLFVTLIFFILFISIVCACMCSGTHVPQCSGSEHWAQLPTPVWQLTALCTQYTHAAQDTHSQTLVHSGHSVCAEVRGQLVGAGSLLPHWSPGSQCCTADASAHWPPPLDLKRSNTGTLFGRGHLIWECIGQACKCQLHLKITRVDDRLRGTHLLHPRIVGAPPAEVLEITHPPHVKSRPQCLSGTCGPVYKESVRETEALKILTGIWM